MIQKTLILSLIGILLSSSALADPATREKIVGMNSYIEPDNVKKDGDSLTFSLFQSGTPGLPNEIGRYKMNCDSREFSTIVKGQASPPEKVLPGEELYHVGKKFCEWEKKGFFEKIW